MPAICGANALIMRLRAAEIERPALGVLGLPMTGRLLTAENTPFALSLRPAEQLPCTWRPPLSLIFADEEKKEDRSDYTAELRDGSFSFFLVHAPPFQATFVFLLPFPSFAVSISVGIFEDFSRDSFDRWHLASLLSELLTMRNLRLRSILKLLGCVIKDVGKDTHNKWDAKSDQI